MEAKEFATGTVPEGRTLGWARVALVAVMVAFSLPTYLTGVEIYAAAGEGRALPPILVGGALLTVIGALCGAIGARSRLSSYMLVRIAFGECGAALVNLAFALSLLGWFGVNVDLFGDALARLFQDILQLSVPRWLIELAAGAVMTVTTVYGFRAINGLSMLLVPVMMGVTALMLYAGLGPEAALDHSASLVNGASFVQGAPLSFGDGVSAVVGGVIVGAIILPDITRFIRLWRGAVYTAFLAYFLFGSLVMVAGGRAAEALGESDLLDLMLALGLGWGAFAVIIAGSWVLNSLNLYSAVLSVEATAAGPRGVLKPASMMTSRLLTLGLGVLGTLAAFLNILDYFLAFLFYLSIVFVPVAGVIIVDYLFLRRAAYHGRQTQQRGYSPAALAAWALGAAMALTGSESVLTLTGIPALDAMLVSAAVYALLKARR